MGLKKYLKKDSSLFADKAEKLAKLKSAGKTIPGVNWVKPSWDNLFIGAELKGTTDLAIAGVAALGIAGAAALGHGKSKARGFADTTQTNDSGSLPGMSYDAVANSTGGRRDLGATGDLVFGLHNSRRRRY